MLINVDNVKEFLGITVETDDNILLPLCQAAQDIADGAVDYQLEGSTHIEFQDNDGVDIIQLRNIPIKAVTSIYDDFDRVYGSDTLIPSTDYTFNEKTGVITGVGVNFQRGANNIKVTYLSGYNGLGASAYFAMPYDLRQALIYLASAMYLEGKSGINVFEGQDMTYRPNQLKKEAYKILEGFRKILI